MNAETSRLVRRSHLNASLWCLGAKFTPCCCSLHVADISPQFGEDCVSPPPPGRDRQKMRSQRSDCLQPEVKQWLLGPFKNLANYAARCYYQKSTLHFVHLSDTFQFNIASRPGWVALKSFQSSSYQSAAGKMERNGSQSGSCRSYWGYTILYLEGIF